MINGRMSRETIYLFFNQDAKDFKSTMKAIKNQGFRDIPPPLPIKLSDLDRHMFVL